MARFSILMPVKNAARTVQEAIDSFCAQDWPNKELVVADGGSTDDTLAILARYADEPAISVISQADASATEGLARGAARARGEMVGLLMADDALAPGALSAWARCLQGAEVASGAVLVRDEMVSPPQEIRHEAAGIGLTMESILSVPYPAAFAFRRSAWDAMEGFSRRYRYAADRDLLMRCRLAGLSHRRTDQPVYMYRRHAGSDTLVENEAVVTAFLADHVRMTDDWLAAPGLTGEDRAAILAWRRTQLIELAARYARGGAAGRALSMIMGETMRDRRVGLEAMKLAGTIVMSRWRRGRAR